MCSIPVGPEGISRKSAFEWTRHSKTSHYFSPRRPPSRAFVVAQLATYFSDSPATKPRNECCKAFKLHVEFARSMVLCVCSFEILIFFVSQLNLQHLHRNKHHLNTRKLPYWGVVMLRGHATMQLCTKGDSSGP